jgi:hypothetical protein
MSEKTSGPDFQFVALFLVIFGSLMTWLACHSNYPELKTLGAGIAGAGISSRSRRRFAPTSITATAV